MYYGWDVALVMVLCSPLVIAVTWASAVVTKRAADKILRAYATSGGIAAESLAAIRTVAALGLEDAIHSKCAIEAVARILACPRHACVSEHATHALDRLTGIGSEMDVRGPVVGMACQGMCHPLCIHVLGEWSFTDIGACLCIPSQVLCAP